MMLVFHIFENVGAVTGLSLDGDSLPFISQGGSSIISNLNKTRHGRRHGPSNTQILEKLET